MSRLFAAAVLLAAFAFSGAFASEPGQPLDCSDMTFQDPGLSCGSLRGFVQPDSRFLGRGLNMAMDNEGFVYIGVPASNPNGIEIHRSRDGGQTVELVARIVSRAAPQGWDGIRFTDYRDSAFADHMGEERLIFDPVGGRLLVWVASVCDGACPCGSSCYGPGYGGLWIASIEGFTTLYEIQQSFTPSPSLGFRVPYMPEGMAGADHFDTYWGSLTHPLDFTQAHPLKCDYPAAAPHVGDYLTVADTVPTPAPGQGVYYVTAATYQGATRYGRKTTAGQLSGRDPALLPVCTP